MGGNNRKRSKQQQAKQQPASQASATTTESASAKTESGAQTTTDHSLKEEIKAQQKGPQTSAQQQESSSIACQCQQCAAKQQNSQNQACGDAQMYVDVVTPTFSISDAVVSQHSNAGKKRVRKAQTASEDRFQSSTDQQVVTMQEVIDQEHLKMNTANTEDPNEDDDDEDCQDDGDTDEEDEEDEDEEYGCEDQEDDDGDFSGESFNAEDEGEPINSEDPRWQNVKSNPNTQGTQQAQTKNRAQQASQQYPNQQTQKQLNDAQVKLGSNLTDMLINLYNGKPTSEFQDHYATIAQIIENQKRLQQQTKGAEITSEALFDLFQQKIENIVGTVKDKLQEDAKKDGLVIVYNNIQSAGPNTPAAAQAQNPQPAEAINTQQPQPKSKKSAATHEILVAKDYREFQPKFDEILSAVGDYFELFKNNTNKLEDLWLQLLDYLKLKNHSQFTVFKRTHYSTYIRKVIKFNVIQKITEEAQKWVNTAGASENLEGYLEKIKEIEKESQFIPDSYESFKRKSYLEFDLNEYTEQQIKAERAQQLKRKEQQEIANAQAKTRAFKQQVDYQQQQKPQQHSVCNDNYNDCQSYEAHKKGAINGCCMCRCIARNHLFSHFGPNKNRSRKTGRKDAYNLQTPETDEKEVKGTGDEQVYKKDLDDLIDYIMQPKGAKEQDVKKTKKKKQKKAKDGSGEREAISEVGGTSYQHSDRSEPAKASVVRSQSPKKVTKSAEENPEPSEPKQSKQQAVKSAAPTSAANAKMGEPIGSIAMKGISDDQFDAAMQEFSRRLEERCQEAVTQHAKKLRPNYDQTWVLSLQTQLQLIDKQRNRGSVSTGAHTGSSKGR